MSRIPQIAPEHLSSEERRIHDDIVAVRGSIAGPFRIWLHSPEFTCHATKLGEFLRYRTSLPARLSELVILLVASATRCRTIHRIHAPLARDAGLPEDTIAAIEAGRPFLAPDPVEAAIREYCTQLLRDRTADAESVDHIVTLLGPKAVVEITGLCGYYTMVAMTLNAFDVR